MILSCVRRMHDYLGYSLGVTSVVRVLHGSSEKRIMQLGLNTLSTYGLMQNAARDWIGDMIECLEMQGYLHIDTAHGGVALTKRAGAVLFHGETVKMRVRAKPQNKKKYTLDVPASTPDADLLSALKNLRLQFARAENVPAYIVFSNAALQDMAAKRPVTIEDFLSVSGVGKHKADRYGEAFVAEIKRYIVKQETDKDIGCPGHC